MDSSMKDGKLLIEPNFRKILEELKAFRISLPDEKATLEIDLQSYKFPPDGQLVSLVDGRLDKISLDATKGYTNIIQGRKISGYDESIEKYLCLEGSAYVTAHSLVKLNEDSYQPIGYVTMNFYTRASDIANNSKTLKYTQNTEVQAQKDYIIEKITLLEEYTDDNSIIMIDGPLIGGDVYTYMIKAMKSFMQRNIIPIFFVKNSNSNLVVDNIKGLKGQYNSDLHWAYTFLKKGQRTNYFSYADAINPNNAKVFCYIKLFEGSPQRVEFYSDIFFNHREEIDNIMDTLYYLGILQGSQKNPQIRLIAIAEKYAREYISLCDIKKMLRSASLTPTINQERFER